MAINPEEKALGNNFPFITHIVIQTTVLHSDILNETATSYASKMMNYRAGWGSCKKEHRDIEKGYKELPKMQEDRAVSFYVPYSWAVCPQGRVSSPNYQ